MRESLQSWRRRNAATERSIDDAVTQQKAEKDAAYKARRDAAAAEKAARHVFTREELADVAAVRTLTGWYRVVQVNRKTVTVATNYSWDDRVLFAKILDVHRIGGEA